MMKQLLNPFVLISSLTTFLIFASLMPAKGQQDTTRVMLVQTFTVPFSEKDNFYKFIDEYAMKRYQANPYTISYRLASHYFGVAEPNIYVIVEYADLASIELGGKWADDYIEKTWPKGSKARMIRDSMRQHYFVPYWEKHTDNLLMVHEKRIKTKNE